MDKLEEIARKGPDAKLAYKVYDAMMQATNPQEQQLMANTLCRYFARWLEISGTYAANTGNNGYMAFNHDFFNPQRIYGRPLVLNEVILQALGRTRPLLEDEFVDEAVLEYEQAESALQRFVHKKPSEHVKSTLRRVKHKNEPFKALGDFVKEVRLLSRISHMPQRVHYDAEEEQEP